jgi:hypothetical protein
MKLLKIGGQLLGKAFNHYLTVENLFKLIDRLVNRQLIKINKKPLSVEDYKEAQAIAKEQKELVERSKTLWLKYKKKK